MYQRHFNLSDEPFGLTPNPAYLYLSPGHREALAAVEYGLVERRGFVTLIGEVGTGKTTLLYSLLGRLGAEVQTAYITYTTQRFEDLLGSALNDLGVATRAHSKKRLLAAFRTLLEKRAEEGRTVALVVDEAQNLEDRAFEELRLLSNFETYTGKLLQIVLVGQPELQERLRGHQLRQIRDRVSVRAFINPLSRGEMRRYIEHRLQRAGGSSAKLFSALALTLIVWRSRGIPRRANILCHNALLFAFGRGLPRVTVRVALEVIAESEERQPGLLRRPALRRVSKPVRFVRRAAVIGLAASVILVAPRVTQVTVSNAARVFGLPTEAPTLEAPANVPLAAADEAPAIASADDPPLLPVPVASATAPDGDDGAPGTAERPLAAEPPSAPKEIVADPPADVLVTVHPGATLFSLMRDVYGQDLSPARFFEIFPEVRRLNPRVKDVNAIVAGDLLRLPPPPAAKDR